jgi:hypothetical protein
VSTLPLRGAAASAVIEQFPVRPQRFHPADTQALATSLLDVCSGYETALRTVISMQRNLERIRRCDEVSAEATLLLQEISRQLDGLSESHASLTAQLPAAGQCLDALMGGIAPEAR